MDNQVGIIDETCYLAYEGQGVNPLTEEEKEKIKKEREKEE